MSRWVTANYVPYKRADAIPSRAAMRVGVPKEAAPGERRVALVPETVGRLGPGVEVVVEEGAGVEAGFADGAYTEAGATIGEPWDCERVQRRARRRRPAAAVPADADDRCRHNPPRESARARRRRRRVAGNRHCAASRRSRERVRRAPRGEGTGRVARSDVPRPR